MAQPQLPRHPWWRDDQAESEMTGYILMVGLLVVFAGITYVLATNLANGDQTTQSYSAVAQWPAGPDELQLILMKAGQYSSYNLDLSAPTGINDVRITLDGHECRYDASDFRVEGMDDMWNVGEKLTFNDDCNGSPTSRFQEYSLTIALGDYVIYQGNVVPSS